MAKAAIFIFTRDRPDTLRVTLDSIQLAPYTKYIIDDSAIKQNQTAVSELCNSFQKCIYLGRSEFQEFVVARQIDLPRFDFLLKPPGSIEWNLGFSRNFALVYSKALGLDKVLFTDDDIRIADLKLIEELFEAIESYKFVGANILGLVDDSILGHIATDLGIFNERMLSGGFLVFNPNTIEYFFLNNYNEDWIWLFLQLQGDEYLQLGEVFQELTDPFANYKSKVIFQEFGEIALDGVLDLYKGISYDNLVELSFWERILTERGGYLHELLEKSTAKNNREGCLIIKYVIANSKNFKPETFQNLFKEFFDNRKLFKELFESVS